jgi:hypothetical protein
MRITSSVPNAADLGALAAELLQRAHLCDGLPEISAGLILMMVSGVLYMQVVFPRGSAEYQTAAYLFTFGLPVLCLGAPWVLKQIRRRYLMDRFGYVEFKPWSRKRRGVATAIAAAVAVVLAVAVVRTSQPDGWLLAGTGVLSGSLAVMSGRLPRFMIFGALVAGVGIWLALAGFSMERGFPILFGGSGVLALISGGIAFALFIRQPVETGD